VTVNTNIMVTIVAGLILIGYLFYAAPDAAPAQTPGVLVAIGVLIKLFNTDTKVEKSVAVSKENAISIATVSQQTNSALETVATSVDGHLGHLLDEIRALTQKVASLEKDKAVKAAEQTAAETGTSQVLAAIAAIPSAPAVEITPPPDEPRARPGEHS
jgi:hypothetical protein